VTWTLTKREAARLARELSPEQLDALVGLFEQEVEDNAKHERRAASDPPEKRWLRLELGEVDGEPVVLFDREREPGPIPCTSDNVWYQLHDEQEPQSADLLLVELWRAAPALIALAKLAYRKTARRPPKAERPGRVPKAELEEAERALEDW
jgi:hypothetical protein